MSANSLAIAALASALFMAISARLGLARCILRPGNSVWRDRPWCAQL